MNSQRIHDQIIARAQGRSRPAVYCERHHVIPKSMGGSDSADNLVWLTGREHYLVHWLLFKIHRTREMAFAWHRMTFGRGDVGRYVSHTYAYARAARALATASLFKGSPLTEDHRRKLSEAKRGRTYAEMGRAVESPLRGREASPELRAKLSAANKGRRMSEEARQKIRLSKLGAANHRFGKETSAETKEKIAAAIRNAAKVRATAALLTIDGTTDNVSGWARHPACQVGASAIFARLKAGWSEEDAVFIPPLPRRHTAEELRAIRDTSRAKLKAIKAEKVVA